MGKEKIIKLKGVMPTNGEVYVELSEIIKEILPELRKEREKWLKKTEPKITREMFIKISHGLHYFLDYLEEKYELRRTKTKKN